MSTWILEGYFREKSSALQRLPLQRFPAIVTREELGNICINNSRISRRHAEFFIDDNSICLRDLNSTNGTFVNHKRLEQPIALKHGDIIHFANVEVRLLDESEIAPALVQGDQTLINFAPLANRLPTGLSALQTILNEKAIHALFQPIIKTDGTLFGYEVLGRGSRENLPHTPYELFRIAESMEGKATELSEMMRDNGIAQAASHAPTTRFFVNTHPEELQNLPRLLDSLKRLRATFPQLPLVIEIHENAIANINAMRAFSEQISALDMTLAFDDFGAGQSRLMELTDINVNYVKFDISLIRNLHLATEAKRIMVASLCDMTRALGITTLAEGVECREELALCTDMHFDLIQGFLVGKPGRAIEPQRTFL